MLRGVRGATTVETDDAGQIADRTSELVRILVESNGIRSRDVASAVFTATPDLSATFPAVAARTVPGWETVPLLCAREIPVPGALARCIRVLIHWNTDRPASEIRHTFLRGARTLRPEWAVSLPGDE
ncbi:MAG TPA: chorismate mutase, partial [Thermoanaerobaculia bacterium]